MHQDKIRNSKLIYLSIKDASANINPPHKGANGRILFKLLCDTSNAIFNGHPEIFHLLYLDNMELFHIFKMGQCKTVYVCYGR